MKTQKQKGSNAERELLDMFWAEGFAALRVAGSGSSKHPMPDVLAGNGEKVFAIECKSTSADAVYLSRAEVVQLLTFAQKFGATPYIAVRFEGRDWVFLDMAQIRDTPGENFKVSKDFAYKDSKRFDELIGKYEQKRLK